jgi:hypothetical protein
LGRRHFCHERRRHPIDTIEEERGQMFVKTHFLIARRPGLLDVILLTVSE